MLFRSIAGRRALALLNRTDKPADVKLDWEKLGLSGVPRSVKDVWNGNNLAPADVTLSVPAHDLALLAIEGEDRSAAEYSAKQSSITGIQAASRPVFAQLHYANSSGHVVVIPVKSTSGFFTSLALPPTVGSETGTAGFILPRGTADLSFEVGPITLRKLDVYGW